MRAWIYATKFMCKQRSYGEFQWNQRSKGRNSKPSVKIVKSNNVFETRTWVKLVLATC